MINKEIVDLYPIRECNFESNDGKVTVVYDKFEKSFLDKIVKNKKSRIAKIDLDKIGSFVWLQCDGKKKVSEIIDLAEKEFEEEEKMVERVEMFLNQLVHKKFIRFYTIK